MMPNLFERIRNVFSPNKSPAYRYTTADLQRHPKYRERVADYLADMGLKFEKLSRPGVHHYLEDGTMSDVFRSDAARQPHDGSQRRLDNNARHLGRE
jgi:hypothetical protein